MWEPMATGVNNETKTNASVEGGRTRTSENTDEVWENETMRAMGENFESKRVARFILLGGLCLGLGLAHGDGDDDTATRDEVKDSFNGNKGEQSMRHEEEGRKSGGITVKGQRGGMVKGDDLTMAETKGWLTPGANEANSRRMANGSGTAKPPAVLPVATASGRPPDCQQSLPITTLPANSETDANSHLHSSLHFYIPILECITMADKLRKISTRQFFISPNHYSSHPIRGQQHGQVILTALFHLAFALVPAARKCPTSPRDAIYAAKYLRHLRHQPHPHFCILRRQVTTTLVHALALQVELEAGNVTQDIEEMAVLCRELLMDVPDSDSIGPIALFVGLVISTMNPLATDPPSNQVIECLRLVRKYKPDLPEARLALAFSLGNRYFMTYVNDDYEEAASIFDEIIVSSSTGDRQDKFVALSQQVVTLLAMARSIARKTPEYTEEAIYRAHAIPSLSSEMDRFAAMAAEQRFGYFGSIEGPKASTSNLPLSQPVPVRPLKELKGNPEIGQWEKVLDLLEELLLGIRDGDITEIDEAIEKGRSAVASAQRNLFTSYTFLLFGDILFEAFERTNKVEYLNESISTHRQVLERPSIHALHSLALGHLVQSLVTRCTYFPGHRTQDLDELVKLISQGAYNGYETLPNRFQFACTWASSARGTRHPSVSTAYESAISLMQDTLLFAPTLQLQHATLATSHRTHSMPLDYASYQVDLHQLEEAVETLERGRALLWSEMRHLRISVDQLLEADPQLGHKFAAINQDLEELTKSFPPSHGLNERNNLISQIQALPGFDSFLTSPSFDTLRSAASSGPVIIINHSIWRSDILILLPYTSPSLIPTSRDFYNRARALKDKLLDSRLKSGLDSGDYDRTLAFVLAELYNLVGKPVIRQTRLLKVPEQSRIWWCPTSVFCSLPLHAMGPIPSDYAQPDLSLPTVGGEIQVVQALDTKVTSLISEAATPAAVIDGFHPPPICKPFEAGFELYGCERLTLLEIVRSHLPTAEFAFLSACHTAEITEGSVVDEGLHLAAAVQYCGFRSVVGTMWAMVDEDGRDLAEHFYKALFSTSRRVQGVPYYERSAKALRVAVKKLRRKKRITLERWVNFVHYGA
ncbi:hypothetical protein BJY52DRAFT_1417909 [Lactarius psammicola]|nr:hypothetical protein BJY52DRAFT_1417909 [Lactarius psammicola]